MNTIQEIITKLQKLTKDDLEKVLKFLSNLNVDTNNIQDISITCCPHCGSISIKKNGHTLNNQRFMCNDCHHSFSVKTNTFLYHSKINKDKWLNFIDFELSHMSLRDEAHYLKLSATTCFRMRHKLYSALSEYVNTNVVLSGSIELDAAYRKINLKGTRPENMPRISKKRGKTSAYSGISHHKICLASALDEHDNMIIKVVGLGSESFEKYRQIFKYFKDVNYLITDAKTCMPQIANELGATLDKIDKKPTVKRYTTDNGNSLSSMNQLHSEITALITKTHGIGTKYIQGYLDFVTIRKKINYSYKKDDRPEALYNLIKDVKAWTGKQISNKEMPISLKEAYYEYRYGIFR